MQKKGLTLLEVLVAMMILAFTVAGSASLFVAAKRYIMHARSRVTAAEAAKYYLEALQSHVRQDKWGERCLSKKGLVICEQPDSWADASRISYNPKWDVSGVGGDSSLVRKVKLTIEWDEKVQ